MDLFTRENSISRMRARIHGLTTSDLTRLTAIAHVAMARAGALGPAFLVRLDKSPSELLAMSVGMSMPTLAAAAPGDVRGYLDALRDEHLAWLLWIVSTAVNEVAPTPSFILEAAGCSELELEEWSFDVGLDGILVNDLVYAARLVLGHFPDGLMADGSNAPPVVLDL